MARDENKIEKDSIRMICQGSYRLPFCEFEMDDIYEEELWNSGYCLEKVQITKA